MVLGFPWLQEWNPDIDWKKKTIKGGPISTRTLQTPEWAKIGLLSYQAQRIACDHCLSCDDAVYIQINQINVAQQWAIEVFKGKEPVKVPKEYLDFEDIFSDEKAKQLLPTRGEFDYQIKFKSGAPETIKYKVYPMNRAETEFTRNWIQENLASGKIQESQSEITCPSFLIKKKNSTYRMVQDYQPINTWTIPDNLPLPLIRSIVEDLEGMNLFSTFDIQSGYNNILVKPEDRHWAAFKTTEGQYEPVVMPFGLMNAPATFQWMINHYAHPLQVKYGTKQFKVYLDDVLITTGKDDPPELHNQIVWEWLAICWKYQLFLQTEKCKFKQAQVDYLGLIIDGDKICPDPTKLKGLTNWPKVLSSKGEVRSTISVFGYQRIFVENFSKIAAPLTKLLKKEIPFEWTTECTRAIQQLKEKLTNEPMLWQPQMEQPFFLEVDTSDYTTGTVLFQKDKDGQPQICRYHSKTFNKTKQRYEIYDKELTAIDRALANWQHLLKGAEVHILTDHKNLMYYWHPHKLTDRAKRVQQRIGEYNYVLHHKPGITNRADVLSRCPDYPAVNRQNEEQLLQDTVFVNMIQVQDIDNIIKETQMQQKHVIQDLKEKYALERKDDLWHHQNCIVVVGNNELKWGVISLYHNFSLAGHLGTWCTFSLLGRDYWWPNMQQEVEEYVKGCAMCQSTKPWTNVLKAPLHPITVTPNAIPFEVVNIDFITKLPASKGYNSIMTIVDHDCTKAAIFIPCKEQMDALGMAELYTKHVFPHYGLLQHIISDHDIRFTSTFTKELCEVLQIKQNLSSAYHPQMDGLAERTNQWVEQYLRIFGNALQNDWADHLPMVQFVHNTWPYEVTKRSPFELLIGNNPRTVIPIPSQKVPALEDRRELLIKTRWLAQKAMIRAQNLLWQTKGKRPFVPYQEGQKVWLEATNLKTTHPTAKLAPRWYSPFAITWVISPVVYQL